MTDTRSTRTTRPWLEASVDDLEGDELQSHELRSMARFLGLAVAGEAITMETATRALAECAGPDAGARVTAALIASSGDRPEALRSQLAGRASRD